MNLQMFFGAFLTSSIGMCFIGKMIIAIIIGFSNKAYKEEVEMSGVLVSLFGLGVALWITA